VDRHHAFREQHSDSLSEISSIRLLPFVVNVHMVIGSARQEKSFELKSSLISRLFFLLPLLPKEKLRRAVNRDRLSISLKLTMSGWYRVWNYFQAR